MKRNEPQIERTERQLRVLLASDCPSALLLGEWTMELLPPDDAAAIGTHVADCQACRAELEQLRSFWDDDEEAESQSLFDSIKEIVLQWVNPPAVQPGVALVGIRGALPRAQTFSADHLWLAVTVQETERGRKNLLALVTRADGYPLEHGTAWLSQENRLFTGGRVDGHGNLVIEDIEPGMYDLGIQCDGTRVWIRGVSV